jgi:3-oxoacyl-[acyl-carrier protein] reductase
MNEMDFQDRTVVVTGGAGGIGTAVLRAFHRRGARVYCLDRQGPGPSLGRFVEVDVTNAEEMTAAVDLVVKDTGRLDVAVACAGINRDRMLWKLSPEEWRSVLAVNLDGCFHLLKAVVPHLRDSEGGSVVLTSAVNGERGQFGQANYAASNAGVIGLAKTAAKELAHFGVRVNVVAPGYIATPMTESVSREIEEAAVKETALGRKGSPEDVAGAILFLSSGLASYITGHVMRVDGGQYI